MGYGEERRRTWGNAGRRRTVCGCEGTLMGDCGDRLMRQARKASDQQEGVRLGKRRG